MKPDYIKAPLRAMCVCYSLGALQINDTADL